jgi:hypothetical protein
VSSSDDVHRLHREGFSGSPSPWTTAGGVLRRAGPLAAATEGGLSAFAGRGHILGTVWAYFL